MVDVTFEEDFTEQNPHATLEDCLNSNNVMFDNYRLDRMEPTIESPFY